MLFRSPGGAPGGTREWEHRVTGSIAIEAALVAAGVFTSAVFWSPRLWDVAAGVLLARAADVNVGTSLLTALATLAAWRTHIHPLWLIAGGAVAGLAGLL